MRAHSTLSACSSHPFDFFLFPPALCSLLHHVISHEGVQPSGLDSTIELFRFSAPLFTTLISTKARRTISSLVRCYLPSLAARFCARPASVTVGWEPACRASRTSRDFGCNPLSLFMLDYTFSILFRAIESRRDRAEGCLFAVHVLCFARERVSRFVCALFSFLFFVAASLLLCSSVG